MAALDYTVLGDNHEWMITPDLAVLKRHGSLRLPDGVWFFYSTMVWEKTDGQWQLIHEHQSDTH